MSVPKKKLLDTAWNTTTFLLTKQPEDFVDGHRVKIVIVGSGYTGVAIGIAILFKVCSKFLHLSNLRLLFRLSKFYFPKKKPNIRGNEISNARRFETDEKKKEKEKGLKTIRNSLSIYICVKKNKK